MFKGQPSFWKERGFISNIFIPLSFVIKVSLDSPTVNSDPVKVPLL